MGHSVPALLQALSLSLSVLFLVVFVQLHSSSSCFKRGVSWWLGGTDRCGCVCLLPQGILRCSRARCEAGDVDENSATHLAIKVAWKRVMYLPNLPLEFPSQVSTDQIWLQCLPFPATQQHSLQFPSFLPLPKLYLKNNMHDGSMSHMLYLDLCGKVPSACVENENQNLIHVSKCGFHNLDAGTSWKLELW